MMLQPSTVSVFFLPVGWTHGANSVQITLQGLQDSEGYKQQTRTAQIAKNENSLF